MEFKVDDVFRFSYSEEERKKRFEPHHCFDGQFIVKQKDTGELYFMDTFWANHYDGFKHWSSSKSKSIEDAQKQGELTFVCNLQDGEEIKEHELKYYADEDIFNLSYQHGCYRYFLLKKGAQRSKEKMETVVMQKISETKYKIESAKSDLERYNETLEKIQKGDTTIWI